MGGKVEYFSEGCANQYKNHKKCLIYATMRKILSCRQVGVVLQLAMGSLQRPASDQLLNVHDMLDVCRGAMENIKFYLITKERMIVVQKELTIRFATCRTIPGTRSIHFFLLESSTCIQFN